MSPFIDYFLEQAAIDCLKELGDEYAFGSEIVFDGSFQTQASLRDSLLPKLMKAE